MENLFLALLALYVSIIALLVWRISRRAPRKTDRPRSQYGNAPKKAVRKTVYVSK